MGLGSPKKCFWKKKWQRSGGGGVPYTHKTSPFPAGAVEFGFFPLGPQKKNQNLNGEESEPGTFTAELSIENASF